MSKTKKIEHNPFDFYSVLLVVEKNKSIEELLKEIREKGIRFSCSSKNEEFGLVTGDVHFKDYAKIKKLFTAKLDEEFSEGEVEFLEYQEAAQI